MFENSQQLLETKETNFLFFQRLYEICRVFEVQALNVTCSICLELTSHYIMLGCSGENLFVDRSNFFLNDYADRQPSSRNTHQEYSFHLYSGGTSLPK